MSIKDGNTNNHNSLGERIRFFRQRAELSQLQLELKSGVSVGSLTRIERNIVSPTKETIAKLAVVLNLDAKELAYLYEINLYLRHVKVSKLSSEQDTLN
jgi:transcriptional regulator with XRE-family HTH domain